ncbi:MAG: cysteine synthase A [Erysipelotrichaceae bacterium]
MKIAQNIYELVGKTPLVQLNKIEEVNQCVAHIIAKVESFNPGGSIKDRIALAMIEDAEKNGLLKVGSTIIEPTSGNTGIGLASIASAKGYQSILVMPESMSIERRKLLHAYGAKIVLSEASKGMKGAIALAEQLAKDTPNSFMPRQFENSQNPRIHYLTTGPEIWEDTDHLVDIIVAGIGTGGTISGIGKYLKEQNSAIQVIGVEPESSAVLSGEQPGPHSIQGIGAGFIPNTLDTAIYDEIIRISNQDAFDTTRNLAKAQGVLAGISSGAALFAAIQVAKRKENAGKNIVVILPDTGERYLSTPVFD